MTVAGERSVLYPSTGLERKSYMSGRIIRVSGPLVTAEGLSGARISDLVRVGDLRLAGEILSVNGDCASIQVYEDTSGLGPGAAVELTGTPLMAELGPGLLGNMFDGIQRPLSEARELSGDSMTKGIDVPSLNRALLWTFEPSVEAGDEIKSGSLIGVVHENSSMTHKIFVPDGLSGTVASIHEGEASISETICLIKSDDGTDHKLTMMQKSPVRIPRPYARRHLPSKPLKTGQKAIDLLYPVAKGGTACLSGSFGSGKTVLQQAVAKWSDADIAVYICCGERGNEITGLFDSLSALTDTDSGEPLINHSVIIACTSDMPIAARESGVYTGITIAEYFRDMGKDVVVIIDSLSRWAEALREISATEGQSSAESDYPAILSGRLAQLYERAGAVDCTGPENRQGSITMIGTLSPNSGNMDDPSVQAALRLSRMHLALDSDTADARRFPAIDWVNSYSQYRETLKPWYNEHFGTALFPQCQNAIETLRMESELSEILYLAGPDSLSGDSIKTLEMAKVLREEFFSQDALNPVDMSTLQDQYTQLSRDLGIRIDKFSAGGDES